TTREIPLVLLELAESPTGDGAPNYS
ncbi:MAG: hypothetical protein JWR83_459, partial [Aeromicrobium sp.]|nr:hypothetical protein [Aeromicrobium sp.]